MKVNISKINLESMSYPYPINSRNEQRMYDRTGFIIIDPITTDEVQNNEIAAIQLNVGTIESSVNTIPNLSAYIAFISQSGTSAPTASILFDTISGLTWSRVTGGTYNCTKTGAFTSNKTSPNSVGVAGVDILGNKIEAKWISVNTIQIKTYAVANLALLSDNVLNKLELQINIYK